MRQSVLRQDQSETKKSVLVLQVWCCVVKHCLLVTLVVIMILKDIAIFQLPFSFSILCLEHHYCGDQQVAFTYLKVKSAKCLCLLPVVLVLRIVLIHHCYLDATVYAIR